MARTPTPGPGTEEREKSRELGALRALLPFLAPYRGLMIAAILALVLTAMISLTLPLAVRRVIDNFGTGEAELLDQYFVAALIIAALLAVGTGLRYALVTRFGERVVADIRKAVFDRVISMSPAFYENLMTGEVLSRITTDTTLILSVIGSSVSIALRNMLIVTGGLVLMLFTSAKLTAMVLLIVPAVIVPILVLGRRLRVLSRENQDWIAASSGNASESLGAVQTVQAFTHESESRARFADVTERSHDAARRRVNTRALMTVIVIFLVFTGIVGVLWIGARDVRADVMSAGALVQFVIYAVMVAGAVAALSEIWGELQRAAGDGHFAKVEGRPGGPGAAPHHDATHFGGAQIGVIGGQPGVGPEPVQILGRGARQEAHPALAFGFCAHADTLLDILRSCRDYYTTRQIYTRNPGL